MSGSVHLAPKSLDLWVVIEDCAYNLTADFPAPIVNSKHRAIARSLLCFAQDRMEDEDRPSP